MTLQAFGLLLVSILLNGAVQFFMKVAGTKLGKVEFSHLLEYGWILIKTPELLAGIAFSALSAIAYFLALTRLDLSVAGPASALIYIFSVVIGHFVFKESVSFNHLVGLGLIVCGVVLVGSKN